MVPSDFETFFEIRKVQTKNLPPLTNDDEYNKWIHDEMKLYWETAQQALIQEGYAARRDEDWEFDEASYQNRISDLEDENGNLHEKLERIHSLSEAYDS